MRRVRWYAWGKIEFVIRKSFSEKFQNLMYNGFSFRAPRTLVRMGRIEFVIRKPFSEKFQNLMYNGFSFRAPRTLVRKCGKKFVRRKLWNFLV